MKKLLSLLLAVAIMMAFAIPAMAEEEEIPTTGQLGENITWNYDKETETLTLSGTGATYNPLPGNWNNLIMYRLMPKHIIVSEGIEYLTAGIFLYGLSVESLSLPTTLKEIPDMLIGWNGMDGMVLDGYTVHTMPSIVIPEGITSLTNSSFYLCCGISDYYLPSTLTEIDLDTLCFSTYNRTKMGLPSLTTTIHFAGTAEQWAQIKHVTGSRSHPTGLTDAELEELFATFTVVFEPKEDITDEDDTTTVPDGEDVVIEPSLTFYGDAFSLSFQDYIGMQILVRNIDVEKYDKVYVVAVQEGPDGSVETVLEGIPFYGYYQLFDQQILSWAMTENVTMTLYGELNGVIYQGASMEGSVQSLAMQVLKNSTDAVTSRIMVDMLNYGAAVQTAFDYNADCLPNTQLEEYAHLGTQGVPATEAVSKPTGSGIEAYSVSLSMQAKVEFQLLFLQDISAYTVKATLNGSPVAVTVDAETFAEFGWSIVSIAASAANMRDTYELVLYDAEGDVVSVNYHLNVEAAAKGLMGGEYNDVVVAMMRYGDAVAAFANQ